MNAITVSGLTAGYDGLPVVRGLSLHVDEGEVVALLGANGAGKTTTLLTIAGVLSPIEGSVEIHGALALGVPVHKLASSHSSRWPRTSASIANQANHSEPTRPSTCRS
jgi:branched-chain amino acid transport system ATP-binding protein